MLPSAARRAASVGSGPIRDVSMQLLPPLPLYRRLLRVHRKQLPNEMRLMGDLYIKDEFRRHRSTDNPLHIVGFLAQWKTYLDELERQQPGMREGKPLDNALLDKLSSEQIGQLHELMTATKEIYASDGDLTAPPDAPRPMSGDGGDSSNAAGKR
ncbi:uncharacterized protein L969DRAFT_423207 [Mixia osmundae IAM 14324]|uniref:Succinate dehydrogenase assembly factor 3 n=1 Tax=Mixia osmundae (strain CBS 9802 / IAM 14324 / JCM 22182 / KY 12970) TaxID=764103 RepID=G7E6K0_MIXOS|nr:uncharacterized protein L969DRAFT_423207 [Mixia osmundae IAM 14324]KEI40382.1 hypothetical protein L969DRAFT_423207 [Mixia osmundae IAM 14324]GAA98460.1 hypothetical protein E5Q_05146 [Mixia osmundae IAM 14324]